MKRKSFIALLLMVSLATLALTQNCSQLEPASHLPKGGEGTLGSGTSPTGSSAPSNCLLEGKAIAHTEVVTAYKREIAREDMGCISESRQCIDGQLSGRYPYLTCNLVPIEIDPPITVTPIPDANPAPSPGSLCKATDCDIMLDNEQELAEMTGGVFYGKKIRYCLNRNFDFANKRILKRKQFDSLVFDGCGFRIDNLGLLNESLFGDSLVNSQITNLILVNPKVLFSSYIDDGEAFFFKKKAGVLAGTMRDSSLQDVHIVGDNTTFKFSTIPRFGTAFVTGDMTSGILAGSGQNVNLERVYISAASFYSNNFLETGLLFGSLMNFDFFSAPNYMKDVKVEIKTVEIGHFGSFGGIIGGMDGSGGGATFSNISVSASVQAGKIAFCNTWLETYSPYSGPAWDYVTKDSLSFVSECRNVGGFIGMIQTPRHPIVFDSVEFKGNLRTVGAVAVPVTSFPEELPFGGTGGLIGAIRAFNDVSTVALSIKNVKLSGTISAQHSTRSLERKFNFYCGKLIGSTAKTEIADIASTDTSSLSMACDNQPVNLMTGVQ